MPPELARPTPRPVRRRAGSMGCGIVLGRLFILPHLGVGLFLLLFMLPATIAAVFFGEDHDGQVIRTWTTRGSKGSITYHIKYAYQAGGQERTGDRTVSKKQDQQLAGWSKGSSAGAIKVKTVRALGYYYDKAILPGESGWGAVGEAVLFAGFWNGMAFVFVYMLWIMPWRAKRLCRYGVAMPGRIHGMHTTRGKTTTYYIDYEFVHPPFGLRKKSQSVGSERYNAAHQGQMVTVLCYPGKKGPTVVYEYGDFECV